MNDDHHIDTSSANIPVFLRVLDAKAQWFTSRNVQDRAIKIHVTYFIRWGGLM